ncbi:MAG: TMEM43 family protein, partial [Patescibacteria group bacterium]
MSDQYKVVTTKGYGSRIVDSIKGVGMGILLFLASFGVLYWNEGRVDLSEVAKNAVEISSTEVALAGVDGKLVSTNGKITSGETLGDGLYLNPGKYLSVHRDVEMYAWVEKTSSNSDTNLGGSETTETTYTYAKEWTSSPSSSGFRASRAG